MDYSDVVSGFAPKNFNVKPKVSVDMKSLRHVLKIYLRDEVERIKRAIRDDKYELAVARSYMRDRLEAKADARKATLHMLQARWGSEEAIDRYLTGFYTLRQYTKVWGEERPRVPFRLADVPYIIAETTDVVIEHVATRYDSTDTGKYSLGPYRIMVPLGATAQDVHWVPVRNPDTTWRHPHHYLDQTGGARTCFGSFSSVIQVTVESVEVIQVLRLVGEFCHRYNQDSPLVRLPSITHKQRLD